WTWRRRSQPRPPRAPPPPTGPRPFEWLPVIAGAVVSLAVLGDALALPLRDWDGRMTWTAQARYLEFEGTVDATVLTQPGWYVAHPWYPLLLPVAQVAVQEATCAGPDRPTYRVLYAALFPAWLLVIYGGARSLAGRAAAAWTALAAAMLPFPAFSQWGGAVS